MKTDAITLSRIEEAHPSIREELKRIYLEACEALTGRAILRFAYVIRTFAEQDKLYAQGRTLPGAVITKAKAGQSYHNYGLAVDIVLLKDSDGNGTFDKANWETTVDFDKDGIADWMEVVRIFTRHGWTWGNDWDGDGLTKAQGDKDEKIVDAPHFQKTLGYRWPELLNKYNNKEFIPNTNYVRL